MSAQTPFQNYYPEELSYCYGCGRLNDHGLHIQTHWDGDETVSVYLPRPYHLAIPGYVYGGLIASLIDCHSTASASAAAYRYQGRAMDTLPVLRYLTAALHVDYLRPTPISVLLEVRGQIKEIKNRKVVIASALSAHGEVCARGEVVAVQMPESFIASTG